MQRVEMDGKEGLEKGGKDGERWGKREAAEGREGRWRGKGRLERGGSRAAANPKPEQGAAARRVSFFLKAEGKKGFRERFFFVNRLIASWYTFLCLELCYV